MRGKAGSGPVVLSDGVIEVVVDPAHGADILTLRHRSSGIDVLFSTPWRQHADQVVAGRRAATTTDPVAGYVERYRGGWNTLCPNAGAPREVHGAPVGFHGEAVTARWDVLDATASCIRLRLRLFSVPVVIDRDLRVEDGGVVVVDQVSNTSDVRLEIDYVSHPALGGPFLDGAVSIDTNARSFTSDPETACDPQGQGTALAWPGTDAGLDLRVLPEAPHSAFGWLSDFDGRPWAMVTNQDLNLAVRVTWDGSRLPYAWFWQELSGTEGFPWYRRAHVMAIEPASTVTSGAGRSSTLTLEPRETVTLPVALCIIEMEETS